MKNEEQNIENKQGNGVLPCVSGSFSDAQKKKIKEKLIKAIVLKTNQKGCFWADSEIMFKLIDNVVSKL